MDQANIPSLQSLASVALATLATPPKTSEKSTSTRLPAEDQELPPSPIEIPVMEEEQGEEEVGGGGVEDSYEDSEDTGSEVS